MDLKAIAGWAVVAFIVWWVITDPASAGLTVHHLGTFAAHAAKSLSTALSNI